MKKLLTTITTTFLLVFMLTCNVFAAEEAEDNDTSNLATVITTDEMHSGRLSHEDDVDWYKFTNEKDYFKFEFDVDYSKINIDNVGDGWTITIYPGDGSEVLKSYSGVVNSFKTPELPFGGDILVKVEADWSYAAPVGCDYGVKVNTYTDACWESEWNDKSATANEIKPDTMYKGALYYAEDVDWYVVDTTTGAFNVTLSTDPNTAIDNLGDGWSISVYRYGASGAIVTYSEVKSKTVSFDIPYKGKFLIKVSADWYYSAPVNCVYNLTVSQHPATELWELEINDKIENANTLVSGKMYSGNLDFSDDVDYFKYKAPRYGVLTLDFERVVSENVGDGWSVSVLNANGKVLYETNVLNDLSIKKTNIAVEKGQTYYVKVAADWYYEAPRHINYEVGLTFKAKTANVTNLKATPTINSIKLTWDKVPGAVGYNVYRYDTTNQKYVSIGTTTTPSYKITGLNSATKKTYYVKAYQTYQYKQVLSPNFTKIVAATKPVAPAKPVVASRTTTSLKLEWKKVARATGYTIYQYNTTTKSWDEVKTTTAANCTIKGLTAGTTYKFKVKAYKKAGTEKVYGAFSKVLTTATKPAKPIGLNVASRTTTSIKLSWDKVEGATGYRVYKYNNVSKKWVAIKTITARSYTFNKLAAGTVYKFKVEAYKTVDGQKIWGNQSDVFKTATKPVKVKWTSVVGGKNKITLKWNKVQNATGYEIQYTYDDNFDWWYNSVEVSGSSVTKTIKDLYAGYDYNVRIRAYRTVNGEKVYGEFSTIKNVAVK